MSIEKIITQRKLKTIFLYVFFITFLICTFKNTKENSFNLACSQENSEFCTTIVINEISTGNFDWIEMYNYGPNKNMTGWYLEIYDESTEMFRYNFPNDWFFIHHYVVILHERSSNPDTETDLYTDYNIPWRDRALAIGLFNNKGVNIDWFQTSTYNGTVPSDAEWDQDISIVLDQNYAHRNHDIDNNKASDWDIADYGTQGILNSGQSGEGYPSFHNLIISEEPLELGNTETITINVYDLEGISQVQIEIEGTTHPMIKIDNFTWQYDSWTPTNTGIKSYTIYAENLLNNTNSFSDSIEVIDTIPPSYSNVIESADPLMLGSTEIISINVDDKSGINQVLIELEGLNYTMVNIGNDTWHYDAWSPSSTGTYFYTIYMEDMNNNWNTVTESIRVVDDGPPSYSNLVESADPLELGSTEIITIDAYDESGINQVYIEIEGVNYTMTHIGGDTWQFDNWTPSTLGTYSYTIYIEDIDNNGINITNSITVLDTTAPKITILKPDPYDQFGNFPPDFDVEILDYNLNSTWYQLIGTITTENHTWTGIIEKTLWDQMGNGTIFVFIYANDSLGNFASENIIIRKDIISPQITIIKPSNYELFGATPPNIEIEIIEPNLNETWYQLTDGIKYINYTWLGSVHQNAWDLFGTGMVTITFYATDLGGNLGSDLVMVNKDITAPDIIINEPNPYDIFGNIAPNVNIEAEDPNLDTIWYKLFNSTRIITDFTWTGVIEKSIWDKFKSDLLTIRFYANDTLGNIRFLDITIIKDITPPDIRINKPNLYDLYGLIPPSLDVNIFDDNLDYVWYQLTNGTVSTANYTWIGSISQDLWDEMGNGTVDIIFYANDTISNFATQYITIRKDIIAPVISIDHPSNYSIFGHIPPDIIINIDDPNLDKTWYQIDNGSIITNPYIWTGLIEQIIWDEVGNGTITIIFFANDTIGNSDSNILMIRKDIIAPKITIEKPEPNSLFGTFSPIISVNFSDPHLSYMWYQLRNGSITTINYTWTGIIEQSIWNLFGNGTIIIIFYANDSLGNLGSESLLIHKDIIAPKIKINYPNSYDVFGESPPDINIIFDDYNLRNTWYQLKNGSLTTLNYTWMGTIEQSVWDQLGNGTITIIFYADDLVGNFGYVQITILKDLNAPIINIIEPEEFAIFGWETPRFKVYISGVDIHLCWYTLLGNRHFFTKTDGITIISINQTKWDEFGNGTIIIEFYVNDSVGNTGFDIITLRKDIFAPEVKINLPVFEGYWNNPPILNISFFDPNYDSLWYRIGTSNVVLINNTEQTIDLLIWNNLEQGEFQISIFANDTVGNINNTYSFTLFKDTLAPFISINLPINNTFSNIPPTIKIICSDPNFNAMWYGDGAFNISLTNNTEQTLDWEIWNNLPDGKYQIFIYANDTFGHLNDLFNLTLYKDTSAPEIIIYLPNNNTLYNHAPILDVYAVDPNLHILWYEIGEYSGILQNHIGEQIDQSIWNILPQGQFQLYIYANDSFGYLNNSLKLTLYKDTLAPRIIINLPYNQTYWKSRPIINITVYDPNLDKIWYKIGTNHSWIENNTETFISDYIWSNLPDGKFIIEIYASDSLSHINDTYKLVLYKDTLAPDITINYPYSNSLIGINAPRFNISINEIFLDKIWYTIVGYPEEFFLLKTTGTINQTAWYNFGNGTVRIIFYANDTLGTVGTKEIEVRKDIYTPVINLNLPNNGTIWDTPPIISISVFDPNLEYIWYRIGKDFSSLNNHIEQQINNIIWEKLSEGEFQIYFFANDSAGNINDSYCLSIYKDTLAPSITINLPVEYVEVGEIAPYYDITIIDENLDTYWYTLDGGLTNITFRNNIGQIDQEIWYNNWKSCSNGELIIIRFCANDSLGHYGYQDVIIKVKKPSNRFKFPLSTSIIFTGSLGGILGITIFVKRSSKNYKRMDQKQKKKIDALMYLSLTLIILLLLSFFV
ncbi:MAG: lamin tail domain-containing protein [Candidatus Hodarchaeota archaeon]